ncbi:hypothetical protein [Poriferisphaera sp. WC338]|uniref:hypothetical protein n=1 Tax=Poriferisphaera sp. WC338 TaxID=3425129 RepID=UPI003D81BC7B
MCSLIKLILTPIICWYGMLFTHKLGHIAAALLTDATGINLHFPLLGFPQTIVQHNPHPLLEIWAGPTLGNLMPLGLLLLSIRAKRFQNFAATFTGFCLLANGAYIGLGGIDQIGDAGDLLRHSSPLWILILFGITSISFGLYIWHTTLKRHRISTSTQTATY